MSVKIDGLNLQVADQAIVAGERPATGGYSGVMRIRFNDFPYFSNTPSTGFLLNIGNVCWKLADVLTKSPNCFTNTDWLNPARANQIWITTGSGTIPVASRFNSEPNLY